MVARGPGSSPSPRGARTRRAEGRTPRRAPRRALRTTSASASMIARATSECAPPWASWTTRSMSALRRFAGGEVCLEPELLALGRAPRLHLADRVQERVAGGGRRHEPDRAERDRLRPELQVRLGRERIHGDPGKGDREVVNEREPGAAVEHDVHERHLGLLARGGGESLGEVGRREEEIAGGGDCAGDRARGSVSSCEAARMRRNALVAPLRRRRSRRAAREVAGEDAARGAAQRRALGRAVVATSSRPPGRRTTHGSLAGTRPFARAAATAAHAPVPHASVAPAPRSQTRTSRTSVRQRGRTRRSSRVEERRDGEAGPRRSKSPRVTSRKATACGLPASTRVSDDALARRVDGDVPEDAHDAHVRDDDRLVPAPLERTAADPGVGLDDELAPREPAPMARWSAAQRRPLPHISGIEPSALMTRMRASHRPPRREDDEDAVRRRRPSRRSQRLRARSRVTSAALAASTTMKSLPSPSYFSKGERGERAHTSHENSTRARPSDPHERGQSRLVAYARVRAVYVVYVTRLMSRLRWITAGESHGPRLTAIVEGIPAGLPLLAEDVDHDLGRRQRGYGRGGRMKIETDRVEIVGGRPRRRDARLAHRAVDREPRPRQLARPHGARLRSRSRPEPLTRPRPGHADLAGGLKYDRHDLRDILERASARETAARTAVGAVAASSSARSASRSSPTSSPSASGAPRRPSGPLEALRARARALDLACADADAEARMKDGDPRRGPRGRHARRRLRGRGDGRPAGPRQPRAVGSQARRPARAGAHEHPGHQGRSRLASAGSRRAVRGSRVHDPIHYDARGRRFTRPTNRAGGLEGGITNGAPVVCRAAMKPIATLRKALASVDVRTKEPFEAAFERSDVCAVAAACVVGEAMVASSWPTRCSRSSAATRCASSSETSTGYRRSSRSTEPMRTDRPERLHGDGEEHRRAAARRAPGRAVRRHRRGDRARERAQGAASSGARRGRRRSARARGRWSSGSSPRRAPRVIAFGGGTVTTRRARRLALDRALVVTLTASPETIAARVGTALAGPPEPRGRRRPGGARARAPRRARRRLRRVPCDARDGRDGARRDRGRGRGRRRARPASRAARRCARYVVDVVRDDPDALTDAIAALRALVARRRHRLQRAARSAREPRRGARAARDPAYARHARRRARRTRRSRASRRSGTRRSAPGSIATRSSSARRRRRRRSGGLRGGGLLRGVRLVQVPTTLLVDGRRLGRREDGLRSPDREEPDRRLSPAERASSSISRTCRRCRRASGPRGSPRS